MPDFDMLCAGFPCQSFSIAGNLQGLADPRGTLFYDIIRIVQYKQPKILLLENVRNLEKHDGGNTLKVILNSLDLAGYNVFYKVLNSKNFGVPQHRERIYLVCFLKTLGIKKFSFPEHEGTEVVLRPFIDTTLPGTVTKSMVTISTPKVSHGPKQIGYVNLNRQGERVYSIDGTAITQTASGGGLGGSTGLYLTNTDVIRNLTVTEVKAVMGFPDSFKFSCSDRKAKKCLGNAVVPNVVQSIVNQIIIQCQDQIQPKTVTI